MNSKKSSMSELPPYSESGPSTTINRVAGHVNTVSIADLQNDYFKIVRTSTNDYIVALTVDPTPIYRVKTSAKPSDVDDILIFPASGDANIPVAAAKLAINPKKSEPVAHICTASPHLPNASWRPLTKTSLLSPHDYKCDIPLVTVPGQNPVLHPFNWRTSLSENQYYELWWFGQFDFMCHFAMCTPKPEGAYPDPLIQIRRGGGLQFELSVILGMFTIYRHLARR